MNERGVRLGMSKLTRKQLTRLGRAAHTLFSTKGLGDASAWKTMPPKLFLRRHIQLKGGISFLLSDKGYEAFCNTVDSIYEARVFGDEAEYSDIWSATRDVIRELLDQKQMPDDGLEFATLIEQKVRKGIDEFTFVAPLDGVELKLDTLQFGCVRIVPSTIEWLRANARWRTDDFIPKLVEVMGGPCWMVASVNGTYDAAERKFALLARRTAGLLGVLAAATFEGGADAFRVRVVLEPEDGAASAATVAVWSKTIQELSFYRHPGVWQPFPLDARLLTLIQSKDSVVSDAIAVVQRDPRNDLEEAIVKSVYWYADAHLDLIGVMRFVKFWSCIETFFPAPTDVTTNVCLGAAVVLTYGPLRSIPLSDYLATKRRLTKLYQLRSRAVHHATHDHVTKLDLEALSQWAAWLVLNMVALSAAGMSERKRLLADCQRLDARLSSSGGTAESAVD